MILVVIDTLRADHLPVYGYTAGTDAGDDGVRRGRCVFDRAYSHAPQTLPSHASMFTGQLPFETRSATTSGSRWSRDTPTLAEMFRSSAATRPAASCRRTCCAPRLASARDSTSSTATIPPDGRGPIGRRRCSAPGPQTLAAAEHWLDSTAPRSRSFSSCISTSRTSRIAPPERFARATRRTTARSPTADEIVGSLFEHLKTRQLYDAATIVVLADHGEGLGDHSEQEHGLFVYDEAIHVPLIIKQEGNAGAGRRVDGPRCSTSTWCRRCLDLVKALRRPAASAAAIAQAAARRHAARCAAARHLLGGALPALSLRLERTDCRSPTSATATSRRRAKSCTTSSAIRRRAHQHRRRAAAGGDRRCAARSMRWSRGATSRRRPTVSAEDARAAAGARLRRRAVIRLDRRRRATRCPIRRTRRHCCERIGRRSNASAKDGSRRARDSCAGFSTRTRR